MSAPDTKITQQQALTALWSAGAPHNESPVVRLARECDVPQKVALRKVEKLCEKGLAEYGVSPWFAWRTPEGEARLRELS